MVSAEMKIGLRTFIIQYEDKKELNEKLFTIGSEVFETIDEEYGFREQYKVQEDNISIWDNTKSYLKNPLLRYINDFKEFYKKMGVNSENPEVTFNVNVKYKLYLVLGKQ